MKPFVLLSLLFSLGMLPLNAQETHCDCKADLIFTVEKIKQMPSFKKQIIGEKAKAFETSFKDLSQQMEEPMPIAECYTYLQKQLSFVRDLHAYISFDLPIFNKAHTEDSTALKKFKTSYYFLNHPRAAIDLQALENRLSQASINALEGVYNFNDLMQIGLYYEADHVRYTGIILSSTLAQWEAGQILLYAYKNEMGKYNLYVYNPDTYQPSMIKGMSFANGRLWSLKKGTDNSNFEFAPRDTKDWVFKQLSDSVQYTYFGNFSSFSAANKAAYQRYYNAHKDKFKSAKHIIIDLRSNRGGNKKISDRFYKLFKKSKAKLYILTNSYTGSNGEQFTVQLKRIEGARHLGQATRGIIAYGTNYGYNYPTPSGHFTVRPTDMDFHKEFFQYEGKGVSPEYDLDFDRDWIDQIMDLIQKNP